jgi:hypothetical protein
MISENVYCAVEAKARDAQRKGCWQIITAAEADNNGQKNKRG